MGVNYLISIAVIDDDRTICNELEKLLRRYEIENKVNMDISVYYDGENLLDDIEEGSQFDLLLLDIELSRIDGVEVGNYIRKNKKDYMCQIIYISSKTGYALDLFRIRPFDFLIKPITADMLFSRLDDYTQLFLNEDCFEFVCKNFRKRLPVSQIMYFESNGRKITIYCISSKYEFYGKLSDLTKVGELKNFMMIHKSFFVNIFHVSEYKYDTLVMSDETELSISKPNRKEIRRLMLQHSADKFK